jgi:hypothetical protein
MRRKRRSLKNEEQAEIEVDNDLVDFDDVLHRELDAPTVIELDHEPAGHELGGQAPLSPGAAASPGSVAAVPASPGSPAFSADMLSAGMSSTDLAMADAVAADHATNPLGGSSAGQESVLQDATLEENAALRAELLGLAPAQEPDTLQVNSVLAADVAPVGSSLPIPSQAPAEITLTEPLDVPEAPEPTRGAVGFEQFDFWDRYDEATASADLFAVPPAAITVVVGSLDVATPIVEHCQATHWVSECDVFVLTEQSTVVGQPTWTTVRRPSDVVAVLEGGESDFPLIVLDIPRELPAWIRPLIARLRTGGVGLVRYVLGDDPSDEDLATWHGELGRPSVLDLASPVAPGRVLELLDRGEPIASVAGMDITTELLLALRLDH